MRWSGVLAPTPVGPRRRRCARLIGHSPGGHARARHAYATPRIEADPMKRLLPFTLLFAAATAQAQDATLPNVAVPALDLQRYAGTNGTRSPAPMFFSAIAWPTSPRPTRPAMTAGSASATPATTQAGQADGVGGRGAPGARSARTAGSAVAPDWLAWVPMVWGGLLGGRPRSGLPVGGGAGGLSRKYLWILSRTPTMARSKYDAIVARAHTQRGYRYLVDELVLPLGTLD